MPATVLEIVSTLLPNSVVETDMVIERYDEWRNPADANLAPTSACIC